MSAEVGRRTLRFLNPDDERPTEADAVVYLMRHLHAADAEFLEAFRDQGVSQAASVNTVAVVSRADEIGGGRVDAMVSARTVARRYRTEPALRGLCQDVVAVAGLLAETSRTLRQVEYTALAELAHQPRDDLEAALLTADRFLRPDTDIAVPADVRAGLLARFGIFGLRLGTALIRQGVDSPAALAAELLNRSGLHDLQHVAEHPVRRAAGPAEGPLGVAGGDAGPGGRPGERRRASRRRGGAGLRRSARVRRAAAARVVCARAP